MPDISTKPYLLRAIYEWCTDNGYTPYLAVKVDGQTHVPMQFVKDGEIVLNISFDATSALKMDNDLIHFHARFGGVSREISVPVNNVIAIYASENGQGMAFDMPKVSAADIQETDGQPSQSPDNPAVVGTVLTSVPSTQAGHGDSVSGAPQDDTDPPKKGGRPALTRIK